MKIPLLDKKDVEIEGERVEIEGERVEIEGERVEIEGERVEIEGEHVEIEGEHVEIYIRDEIIEYLKGKGWRHATADDESEDETNDFFTKDGQLIQVIINDDIPEEVMSKMNI